MNIERLFKKVITALLVMAFLPQIFLLITHFVREVVRPPSTIQGARTVEQSSDFGFGVLSAVVVLVLVLGVLARFGTALRNRDPYRQGLDRRARSSPRFPAERPESLPARMDVDDSDDPAFG